MQSNEVTQLVEEFLPTLHDGDSIFVSGDFNSVPTDEAVKIIAAKAADTWTLCGDGSEGWTFNAEKPFERIDYIFQAPTATWRCANATVPNTLASDHRPFVADFAL